MRFFEGKPALECGLSGHENSVERAGRDFALPAPIIVAGGQAHLLSSDFHLLVVNVGRGNLGALDRGENQKAKLYLIVTSLT